MMQLLPQLLFNIIIQEWCVGGGPSMGRDLRLLVYYISIGLKGIHYKNSFR